MILIPIEIVLFCSFMAFIMNHCKKKALNRLLQKQQYCTVKTVVNLVDIQCHYAKVFGTAAVLIIIGAIVALGICLLAFSLNNWEGLLL